MGYHKAVVLFPAPRPIAPHGCWQLLPSHRHCCCPSPPSLYWCLPGPLYDHCGETHWWAVICLQKRKKTSHVRR